MPVHGAAQTFPVGFMTGTEYKPFVVSDQGYQSYDAGMMLAGAGDVLAGLILGRVTRGTRSAGAAAKEGGNTGAGALTMNPTAPLDLATVKNGIYTVRAIGNAFDASVAADADNTGGGAASMHTTETAAGVIAGVYRAVCIEEAAGGGTFSVEDPDGVNIGIAVVGALFDGVVKFTIADGDPDYSIGDAFDITVEEVVGAGTGVFEVTDPDGVVLGNYTIGGAAWNNHIAFSIADGDPDFVVGDGFDITVNEAAATLKVVPLVPTAVDGSQNFLGILVGRHQVGAADVRVAFLTRLAEVQRAKLIFAGTPTDDQKNAVYAQMAAQHIMLR